MTSFWARAWRRFQSPSVLPLRVTTFILCVWLALYGGIGFCHPGFPRGLAYAGVLFGICGAAVLFWETNLAPDEVTRITYSIQTAGQSPNLTRSDRQTVMIAAITGCSFTALIDWSAWHLNQRSPNPWRLAVQLAVGFMFAVAPSLALYSLIKVARRWLRKQADLLRDQPHLHESAIQRYTRGLGFIFLILSGVCQLPALLGG